MIKLVVFDMDGVLTDYKSSWDWIHNYYNQDNSNNIKLFMEGKIDYQRFMDLDIELWLEKEPKLSKQKIQFIFDQVPLMRGVEETFKVLREKNLKTAVVTGGINILAERLKSVLNIDYIYANSLQFNDEGVLNGTGKVNVNPYTKQKTLRELMKTLNLSRDEVMVVGDGIVDVPMFKEVKVSIAFDPISEEVANNAKFVIRAKNLAEILKYL